MRNSTQPTSELLTQWRDPSGSLWCAQAHYPKGKRHSEYCLFYVSMVGTTVSIPCASVSQLWHEVGIRQQAALPGF